jgi:DNA polymerase-3 subunit alpha (Gram-positive type)
MEDKGVRFPIAEWMRLAFGCTDIKRTECQNPRRIVIVSQNMEIYNFYPVKRPGNDQNSDNITTHFDFNSLHDKFVNLMN